MNARIFTPRCWWRPGTQFVAATTWTVVAVEGHVVSLLCNGRPEWRTTEELRLLLQKCASKRLLKIIRPPITCRR